MVSRAPNRLGSGHPRTPKCGPVRSFAVHQPFINSKTKNTGFYLQRDNMYDVNRTVIAIFHASRGPSEKMRIFSRESGFYSRVHLVHWITAHSLGRSTDKESVSAKREIGSNYTPLTLSRRPSWVGWGGGGEGKGR